MIIFILCARRLYVATFSSASLASPSGSHRPLNTPGLFQKMTVTVIVDDNNPNHPIIHLSESWTAPHTVPAFNASPQPTPSSETRTMHKLPAPAPVIAGLHTAGIAVLFIIAWAATMLCRRRRRKQSQLLRIVHPFAPDPAMLFEPLLNFADVTTIDAKGCRRLLPPVDRRAHHGVIPPSKLTVRRHSAPNAPARTFTTTDTREEDSGLRMMEDPQMNVIRVLPPAYTVV